MDAQIARARGPTSRAMRSRISPAALLVKVMARMASAGDPGLADQPRDAVGQDARLAAAGAGQHEQRAVAVEDGLALGGIEAGEEVGHPSDRYRRPRRRGPRKPAPAARVDALGARCDPRAVSPAEASVGAARMSPLPRWLRAFFLLNVIQDFAIGFTGLLAPEHIVIPLKGLSPLNARFIAALYLGGGVVILIVAFVRRAVDARIALYAFFVITALVLLMTFAYWEEFTTDGVPWLWLFTYIVNPILAPLAIVTLGLVGPAEPGGHRLTALFIGEAVVFGASGIALLLAPERMVDAWPWALTPLLARVYAAFFLAFAVGRRAGRLRAAGGGRPAVPHRLAGPGRRHPRRLAGAAGRLRARSGPVALVRLARPGDRALRGGDRVARPGRGAPRTLRPAGP